MPRNPADRKVAEHDTGRSVRREEVRRVDLAQITNAKLRQILRVIIELLDDMS